VTAASVATAAPVATAAVVAAAKDRKQIDLRLLRGLALWLLLKADDANAINCVFLNPA